MPKRSLRYKAKVRRRNRRLRAKKRAQDNDGEELVRADANAPKRTFRALSWLGEVNLRAVKCELDHEDDEQVEGSDDDFLGGVDGRVEDGLDETDGMDREQGITDDWIRRIMADDGEVQSKLEGGVVLFKIDEEWRQLPLEHWELELSVFAQLTTYRRCQYVSCGSHLGCSKDHPKVTHFSDCLPWIPKARFHTVADPLQLIYTLEHIEDSDSLKSTSPRSLSSRLSDQRDAVTLGAQIPPEIFPLLYGWVGRKLARTCRLVCRHWDKQCRERAFTRIDIHGSEKKVLDLVRFKYDPAWRHIPSFVEWVDVIPEYTDQSRQPWLHLLDPRWRPGVRIWGPFARLRTIRSIHFALPRSVPPSFSRGITSLDLWRVTFRHFNDTACLVSGLPDLEVLCLSKVTWKSAATQLPRRRPRLNRNKLGTVFVVDCKIKKVKSPSFLFPVFTLFPDVYSSTSFFSADIVTTANVILHLVSSGSRDHDRAYNIEHKTDAILDYLCFETRFGATMEPMLTFCSPKDASTNNKSISVFIDLDLPSLSTRGEVQYTVAKTEARKWGRDLFWYQASLESEELQGEGIRDPSKVYL